MRGIFRAKLERGFQGPISGSSHAFSEIHLVPGIPRPKSVCTYQKLYPNTIEKLRTKCIHDKCSYKTQGAQQIQRSRKTILSGPPIGPSNAWRNHSSHQNLIWTSPNGRVISHMSINDWQEACRHTYTKRRIYIYIMIARIIAIWSRMYVVHI